MKITFYGAAHQVTGSMHLIDACGKRILVDCGMEQGPSIYEKQAIPFQASSIDYVLLTHAHIDHSGRLPLLYAEGFSGEIYCTQATNRLCEIMLKDSAHIQEREAEWHNMKADRTGGEKVKPLYTMEDAENVLKHFHTHEYRESFNLEKDIRVRFLDAGHLLGSSFVEITVTEDGDKKTIVFSGDLGNLDLPLMNNPTKVESADYVVIESTYGNRYHTAVDDPVRTFAHIIENTFHKGGKVIIPAFAVGRTQELLYYLREIKERNLISDYKGFPVYVDSPLALEATDIFSRVNSVYYNADAKRLLAKGKNPISFPNLRTAVTQEESMRINECEQGCVIISASGMCEAGRIRHHLKHNLWNDKNTVIFSGFQVQGTLGHALLNGAKSVKLFGEDVLVKANIVKLDNISGHADRDGLLNWLKGFTTPPKKVFVVHGDDEACEAFARDVQNELGIDATAPFFKEEHDLTIGIKIKNGIKRIPTENPTATAAMPTKPRSQKYRQLYEALNNLKAVVEGSSGLANREMEKFTKQIEELTKHWKD